MVSQEKDIYDELWESNIEIAQKTLKTQFVQHMQLGDLQADKYIRFMIQDIKYLVCITEMLAKVWEKMEESVLKDFMKCRYESYNRCAKKMLEDFNLKGVSDINFIEDMKNYVSEYENIKNKEEPIFFAVALLPCTRLWEWLANQLTETYCNAYFIWKKENMSGNPEKYRDLLKKHLTSKRDKKKANKIFQQQMQHEYKFFESSLNLQQE